MQKPYFLERELPGLVREYMETHDTVDLDVLTQHLIDTHHKFRHKKFKPFRKSVTSAYEWNYKVMEKEEKEAAENGGVKKTSGKDSSDDVVTLENLDGEKCPSSKKGDELEDEIVSSIMKKNRKGVPELPVFPTETPKLEELQGLSSLVQPVGRILWLMMERPEQRAVCLQVTGPESCGKTSLIRAMADKMSLPLHFIEVESVLAGGPLSSPLKKMQEELAKAHSALPGVILFHQLDRLYSREVSAASKPEQHSVASVVFKYIAGMAANSVGSRVLIVAETSKPELLDWRLSECFSELIHIAPPSVSDKESILRKLCSSEAEPEVDLASVALKASGFVAGDLVCLVKHARKLASNRVFKESSYGQAKSFSDFPSGPQSNDDGSDPAKLLITTDDLLNSVKLVVPSLKRHGFPAIPDTTWADIGGLEVAKKGLRDCILKPIKRPEYSSRFGLRQNSGVLLWGPPGCGKTLLAKAVANEAGINLLTVNGPELLSMYQGESERAVREVFARAASVAPCVIFFDEFDSLCPRRSKTGSESGSKSTIVNMLLTEMDGFMARPGIYLIAATNLPSILDPAVLRPGRFDTKVYVGLPNAEGRVSVLKATTKNGSLPCLASDVDVEAIAQRQECQNFTGADCRNLVDLAIKAAIDEHEKNISTTENDTVESVSKKRKLDNGSTSDNRPTKIMAAAADIGVPSMKCFYPDGEFVLYARHFDMAFKEVKPSVLEKERLMYEFQRKEFESGPE